MAWVWVALDRTTRQAVACIVGDRSADSRRHLWAQTPEPWRPATCDSRFWDPDQVMLPTAQHEAVGRQSGDTNRVERWRNTLRQRLAQFVRKTLSFSRSGRMHDDRLLLFLQRYNEEFGGTRS